MPILITAATPVNVRPPADTFVLQELHLNVGTSNLIIVIIEADSKGVPLKAGIRLSVAIEGRGVLTAVEALNAPSDKTFVERLVDLFIAQGKLAPGSTVETV